MIYKTQSLIERFGDTEDGSDYLQTNSNHVTNFLLKFNKEDICRITKTLRRLK